MKKAGAIWRVGWRLAVAVLLLAWILHSIFLLEGRRAVEAEGASWTALTRGDQWEAAWRLGPAELWRTVRRIEPLALLLSLVCMGMTILLGVIRWRLVLLVQGLRLSFTRAAEISLVAHFFNSFLLGSTGGDLLKAYYAARETHHKKTEAVTTVVVDRMLGLFAMLLFATIMMVPNFRLLIAYPSMTALAWLIFMMFVACAGLVGLSFWGGLSNRWPAARTLFFKLPKSDMLERALTAARQYGQHRLFLLQAMILSMILNVFCVLQIMVLASGFGAKVPSAALFVIVPIIVCVSALPITPSGLGVRENLYVIMLGVGAIGVDATMALSISLLAYGGSLAWSVIGGIVYVLRKERDHLAEIAGEG